MCVALPPLVDAAHLQVRCVSVSMSVSESLSICLSVWSVSVCLSICLSICLSESVWCVAASNGCHAPVGTIRLCLRLMYVRAYLCILVCVSVWCVVMSHGSHAAPPRVCACLQVSVCVCLCGVWLRRMHAAHNSFSNHLTVPPHRPTTLNLFLHPSIYSLVKHSHTDLC